MSMKFGTGSVPVDNFSGGMFDYNDTATATTPINITGGAGFVDVTNDELGAFTNKVHAPNGVTDVWDASNNRFDWGQLSLGDMIDIRLDIEVTTVNPNQEVEVVLELGIGGGAYNIPFFKGVFKSAGTQSINRFNGIYMGDSNTKNNFGKFKIKSDGNATVKVNGWYCKIIKKG